MSVHADDPRAAKVQIADALRDEIRAGQLQPGDRLDSVRALAERFGVASQTVTNALRILIDEGTIRSVPNRGYFVQDGNQSEPEAHSPEYVVIKQQLDQMEAAIRTLADRLTELEERSR